jgi:eukaryotic-like serine/threonine-protein kinase
MASEHSERKWARRLALWAALALAGVGAGVAAALATAGAWWIRGVAGAVGGLTGLGAANWIDRASQRRDTERQRRQVARQALQGTPARAGDVLPLVRDTRELDARVHHAVLALPYIRRDVEEEVRSYLACGQPVLLVGPSMVGKTRIAATVIRDMFADHPIVIPDSEKTLAELDAADISLRGSVIFLDDINRLIGVGGITDGTIRRLSAENILVGTIRATLYESYMPTDQVRRPEWDVVSAFERVFIRRELSNPEQNRLSEAVADSGTRERIVRTGLGEYVGAAEQIDEELRLGPSVNPVGYALVQGAADWQGSGIHTPVPASLLSALALPHLDARHHGDLADRGAYKAALQWATKDINPTVALLQKEEPDNYFVFDYVMDLISRAAEPIPEITWPLLIQHADPSDLFRIGYVARVNYGQDEVAMKAFRLAVQSEQLNVVPKAALYLGMLLMDHGDWKSAREAFQKTIAAGGDPQDVSIAAYDLGAALIGLNDIEGAKEAYRKVIALDQGDLAERARQELNALCDSDIKSSTKPSPPDA